MSRLQLEAEERAMLAGEQGEATRIALSLVVRLAGITGAERLQPIGRAHIDSCLYHGRSSLDFAERLVEAGGRVRVPATLNVGSIDLLHPELFRGTPELADAGRALMRAYERLGCQPTWTCAPYQETVRPAAGEHVAWAESNAIVFANSVLGARTERYGDFIDICAAISGRVPFTGLHTEAGRRGEVLFRLRRLNGTLASSDVLFATLGHVVGRRSADAIPVIDGIERATEDQLKALGAAAASSGSVALFHMVGVTPEAATLEDALHDTPAARIIELGADDLHAAARELDSAGDATLTAVSVGTPHFSFAEFQSLHALLDSRRVHESVDFYASTSRAVFGELERAGIAGDLRDAGITLVTDTCTYVTPILRPREGAVMTNSAKWAWYAPANLGVPVRFGSLRECVESGVRGTFWRDPELWRDG